MPIEAPYGSWTSPITAQQMAEKGVEFSFPRFFDGSLYWMEFRPQESARTAIVQRSKTGETRTLTTSGFSAHTRAHEYGGCCYAIGADSLFFVNDADQRIYKQDLVNPANTEPLTQDRSEGNSEYRFADLVYDHSRHRLIAVAEVHRKNQQEPQALLVAISAASGELDTLAEGADFYACPRLSPNDQQMLWLEWNHPNMPWDETHLWRACFDDQGALTDQEKLSQHNESVFQPEWSADGDIYFVSDRNQWWNLYRYDPSEPVAVWKQDSECGLPLWQFGMTTWGFLSNSKILLSYCRGGIWQLDQLDLESREKRTLNDESLHNHLSGVATDAVSDQAAVIASGPKAQAQLCLLENDNLEPISPAGNLKLHEEDISQPTEISFPTTNGDESHAYYYRPINSAYQGPELEKPPLIVLCHGGPTASTTAAFNLKVQFWTCRGFAVVDVNYRGSTGYGRAYRDKLRNNWGIYDVDDACAAALFCANQGWADSNRLIIRGSSAGGYTVLSALCFRDIFSAGCSLYGIGDLSALAEDTHKFEAHYTDSLIAPLTNTEVYESRSPINHIEGFNCPCIFFQGLKDRVVPPEQALAMAEALNEKEIPVALVTYPEEAHGFRHPDNTIHAFNAELAFYGAVFGFDTDSTVEDLPIQNLGVR